MTMFLEIIQNDVVVGIVGVWWWLNGDVVGIIVLW